MLRPVTLLLALSLTAGVAARAVAAAAERGEAARVRDDPVDKAFELPRGVVLKGRQVEAYRGLRQQLEPPLRSALERVQSASEDQAKRDAAAEVKRIRESIRLGIQDILRMPPKNPAQAAKKGDGQGKKTKANDGKKRKKAHAKKRHRRKPARHPPKPRKGGAKRGGKQGK